MQRQCSATSIYPRFGSGSQRRRGVVVLLPAVSFDSLQHRPPLLSPQMIGQAGPSTASRWGAARCTPQVRQHRNRSISIPSQNRWLRMLFVRGACIRETLVT